MSQKQKRTIVILQPTYLPWLGYFDLIHKADIFIIYDHVQFEKDSWQQRNKIRDKKGEILLTVPVLTKGRFGQTIKDVVIDKSKNFASSHLKSIKYCYSKSANFMIIFPELEFIYSKSHNYLLDLNLDLINLGVKMLGVKTKMLRSSNLDVKGKKVEALIDICDKLGATDYLSPIGSKEYIEENNLFDISEINLIYQNFQHPTYKQINYSDFISHLAFIDYLFNCTSINLFKN